MDNKIPQETQALRVHKYGSLPVLQSVKLPLPNQLKDTDIIVKVQATGITHFDLFLMSGKIPLPMQFPYLPGSDCVGRVVAAGKAAQPILGKRVLLAGAQGTWAEYIPFDMNGAIPIAEDVPVQSAAYGFTNPFTAIGLFGEVKAAKRKGIVVDAAASSLGRMINRLAKKEKIPVLNVVRRKQHHDALKKEGFDNVIVTEGDWKPKYDALVKSLGVDTLIDSLGSGQVLDKLIKGLPAGGLVYIISSLEGGKPIVDMSKPHKIEAGGYTIQSWTLYSWFKNISAEDKKKLAMSHSDRLKGDLATNVAASFKFKDIGKAIEATKTNNHKGKILLVP